MHTWDDFVINPFRYNFLKILVYLSVFNKGKGEYLSLSLVFSKLVISNIFTNFT